MAGGFPRTNSAMRLDVKSWVTTICGCVALNFATRLLKYGTTSGLVSSKTILVTPPPDDSPDEEHPATSPGPASAAAPKPSAFIIERRLSTGPPGAVGAAVRWFRPDRISLSCCTGTL